MSEKLIIGTVQFGLDYGVTNNSGKITESELDKIFNFCHINNLLYFDTAQDYGNSEEIMSEQVKKYNNFKIITKAKFKESDLVIIENTIKKSIRKFERINYFLLHSMADYSNQLIDILFNYKTQGIIEKIGVSIYKVEEAIVLLDDPRIDIIQLPLNYIDNQWDNEVFKQKLSTRPDIEIHVRSIFLQGILLNPILKKPVNIPEEDFNYLNQIINELCIEFGLNKLELCFGFINSIDWVNKFLIGIDNFEHLKSNYSAINKNIKLSNEQLLIIKEETKKINQLICNPSQWIFKLEK